MNDLMKQAMDEVVSTSNVAWKNSEFEPLLALSADKVGELGELWVYRNMRSFLEPQHIDWSQSTNRQKKHWDIHDLKNECSIEVKTAKETTGARVFQFENIQDRPFELLILVAVMPEMAGFILMPKRDVPYNKKGFLQSRGRWTLPKRDLSKWGFCVDTEDFATQYKQHIAGQLTKTTATQCRLL